VFDPEPFEFLVRLVVVALISFFTIFALYITRRLKTSVRELDIELAERHRVEAALRESETRFRLLVEQTPGAVYQGDLGEKGQCFYVSSQIEAMLGFSVQEWLDDPSLWSKQLHPEDRAGVLAAQAHAEATCEPLDSEFRMVRRDGRVIWVYDQSVVMKGSDDRVMNQGVLMDITERKNAEESLLEVNAELSHNLKELRQRNREITLINEMAASFQTGLTIEEVYAIAKHSCARFFPGAAGTLFRVNLPQDIIEPVVHWGFSSARNNVAAFSTNDCPVLQDGQTHVAESGHPSHCPHATDGFTAPHLCIPLIAHGETLGVLSLQSEDKSDVHMTPAKQQLAHTVAETTALALANLDLRETLRQQSIRDSLTGLFNRRYLEETLEREVQRAKRGQQPVGIIMIDIDFFKEINDAYGHEAGDAALRELGGFLLAHIRQEDIACRYGGEEFILILPGATLLTTRTRAQLLRKELARLHVHYEGRPLNGLTMSFGVAVYPDHGATGQAVVRSADMALYHAKQSGRNRIEMGWSEGADPGTALNGAGR